MDNPIYLDHAATTPLAPEVAKVMSEMLLDPLSFGNPASNTHSYGWRAQTLVEESRQTVGALIGAKSKEILFTSGATEANNLVLQGLFRHFCDQDDTQIHIITSSLEHKAVLDTCAYLEKNGAEVTYLLPNSDGLITADLVNEAIKGNTALVSIMHVNNELGNINPIESIGALCRDKKIFFHVDAAQSVGKLPIDVKSMPIDFLTFSGHKIYGPKGIGALYFSRKSRKFISPLSFGGGQERGIRPGTLATHQIAGMAEACRLLTQTQPLDLIHARQLNELMLSALREHIDVELNTNKDPEHAYPGILNIRIPNIDPDLLMMGLPNVAFSTGSACNSQDKSGSHVLEAIRRGKTFNGADLRLSFGRSTSPQEIKEAATLIGQTSESLLALA